MHWFGYPESALKLHGPLFITDAVDKVFNAWIISYSQPQMSPAHKDLKMAYEKLVSMMAEIPTLAEKLKLYHGHVMRGNWQRVAVEQKHATVQRDKVMILFDYVMKLLPMRSIESRKYLFRKSRMVDISTLLSWKCNSETQRTTMLT